MTVAIGTKPAPVTLVIPNLVYGGAERAMVGLANWLVKHRRQVNLITFDHHESPFALSSKVKRFCLNNISIKFGTCLAWPEESQNIARLRQAIMQAGAGTIISFLSRMNLRTLLAAEDLRVIVCERVFPPAVALGAREESLRRALYPKAHKLVVQTRYARDHWAIDLMPAQKVEVIANAVFDDAPLHDEIDSPVEGKYILAMGRLNKQKGFDILIDAFARICHEFPDYNLLIVGEGEERESLTRQINNLQLAGRVVLPGNIAQPGQLMKRAEIFVLSSRFEGFPNALMEAMNKAMACIATDCLTGPRELISHQKNGLLIPVENMDALANCMRHLLTNAPTLEQLGNSAAVHMREFTPEKIMPQWENLVNENSLWGGAAF